MTELNRTLQGRTKVGHVAPGENLNMPIPTPATIDSTARRQKTRGEGSRGKAEES
jgi:hypothetical protein